MNFKKDYINYVLHSVIQSEFYGVRDDIRVRKVLEKIISIPDVAKATFLAGKTDGLEVLFKYLLYVSDKIDKSQITIFNIRDNFEYDLQNLKRICSEIKNYRNPVKPAEEQQILETAGVEEQPAPETAEAMESETGRVIQENVQEIITDGKPETIEETAAVMDEAVESDEKPDFTLIENKEKETIEEEVFALTDITRSLETQEPSDAKVPADEADENEETESVPDEEIIKEAMAFEDAREEINKEENYEDEMMSSPGTADSVSKEEEPQKEGDFEFEIVKESSGVQSEVELRDTEREGSVTSEAYYKFENKFFEEVKILEKLFSRVKKECKKGELKKLSERTLQSITEIIEISSELSNLTRQLQFDLTADIFLTINLLFTKAIKTPSLINPERIELVNSSLMLVKSLIKDEDYLGYDEVVNKIEVLKDDIKKPAEQLKKVPPAVDEQKAGVKSVTEEPKPAQEIEPEPKSVEHEPVGQKQTAQETVKQKPVEIPAAEEIQKQIQDELTPKQEAPKIAADYNTSLFKMKYLVKEFEKSFLKLGNIQGEYDKFEVLEVVDDVNDLLKMLAKISASVNYTDVLKLSEVSYVFLKYLKDYKMDLLDNEIQQIIKYIIFTYKMLLTSRKPEDFEILVQYLNNPVMIFTDT